AHLGPQGVEHLVELTGHANEWVRVRAVQALRQAGEAAAVALPRLREVLRTPPESSTYSSWQRQAAVATLRWIGPAASEAIPDLLPFVRGTNWGDQGEEVATLTFFGEALLPHLPAIVGLLREQGAFWAHARAARLLARLAEFTPDVLEP